jgi:hypothetical protein
MANETTRVPDWHQPERTSDKPILPTKDLKRQAMNDIMANRINFFVPRHAISYTDLDGYIIVDDEVTDIKITWGNDFRNMFGISVEGELTKLWAHEITMFLFKKEMEKIIQGLREEFPNKIISYERDRRSFSLYDFILTIESPATSPLRRSIKIPLNAASVTRQPIFEHSSRLPGQY